MEEPLKARLIGAAVLVTIAVLLIPELLSGRKAVEPVVEEGGSTRGTRTFTIELGQGPGKVPRTAEAAAPAAPSTAEPAPAVANAQPDASAQSRPTAEAAVEPEVETQQGPEATQAAAPRPAGVEPQGEVEPKPAPDAPPAATAGGAWAVQVGAFGSVETARGLVKELKGAGYSAYVAPITRGGKTLHRVRVGPQAERAGADQLARRLAARGLPATVVRND